MLKLKDILAKDPEVLSDAEKMFLFENISKLSDDQKEKFADALEEAEEKSAEDDGLDEDSVKALISKSIEETLEKKADDIADKLVSKFLSGAKDARKKALEKGKQDENLEKKNNSTRMFLKALFEGDKATMKALTTTTPAGDSPDDANAGALIPEELRAEVLRIANDQFGLARRDMFYLPFSGPGNSRNIPTLGTSVSVYWTGEGAKKRSTQPKFNLVAQTLKKLAAIVPMTEEILEDSAIDLTNLVATLFAEAVAQEEDLQFFAGTGSPWTGILNNGSVNKVEQASGGVDDITADDLLDMIDATPTGALNGSKFYMHRTVLSKIRKLKDDQGQYIYQNPGGALPATIWNYPVETSDAFPAVADIETGDQYILFGNLKKGAVFGDKQQLRIKLLDQATITDTDDETVINLAEQDMVALRIVERVGYVVALPTALTVLEAQEPQS